MRTWLIEKRRSNNLSQEAVAKFCKISQQAYSFFELGIRRPKPETAMRLAKTLGFDWQLFYVDDEDLSKTENSLGEKPPTNIAS